MNFEDLKLNKNLKKNLKKMNIEIMTMIQEKTFNKIYNGIDLIGISKTGSGKSLAFILPILQKMIEMNYDGFVSLFITPTRELALQLYATILKLTHKFNVNLSIGGIQTDDLKNSNIIVGTPGRILQNFEEGLDGDNIQFLIVDEADKLVEMGFKNKMIDILEYLNPERQTLLFSATCIPDIEIFKLKNPEIISVYDEDKKLEIQNYYYFCSSSEKLKYLYSLLDNEKSIVFFSTCKTAKFYFLLFSKLKFKVFLLSGNLSQSNRIKTYENFLKNNGILFCTDLGARGLDFKAVKKIIQFDCPDTPETYIHRAGRTGRYNNSGVNILLLLKSEEKFLKSVSEYNIPVDIFAGSPVNFKNNFERIIKSLVYKNRELRNYLEKYIRTYMNFLNLNKKKYKTDVENEIKSLREVFGLI